MGSTDHELAYLWRCRWALLPHAAASLGMAIALTGLADGLVDVVPGWLHRAGRGVVPVT